MSSTSESQWWYLFYKKKKKEKKEEELTLYNVVYNLTISNPGSKVISSLRLQDERFVSLR
jgi:hypothetical protein